LSRLVCVDASLVLAFVLEDEPLHREAKAFIRRLSSAGATLCAPPLFVYECESIIRLQVFKGALSQDQAQEVRSLVKALEVEIEFSFPDSDRTFEIATLYGQPRSYDAAYAAHAEARGIDFVTIDAPFFEAVNGEKRPKTATPLSYVKLLRAGTFND